MLRNKISCVLTVVLLYTATCFAGQHKARFQGNRVTDFQTQQTIKKEIGTWKDAPLVDHLLLVTKSVTQNVTVYEMKYKAKNGDICEGEWIQAKLAGKLTQSSHEYECHKEDVKRRRVHNVLNVDEPMFAPHEDVDYNELKLKLHHTKMHERKVGKHNKLGDEGNKGNDENEGDEDGSENSSISSASDDDSGDDDD